MRWLGEFHRTNGATVAPLDGLIVRSEGADPVLTAVAGTLLKHRKQYYGALEAASRDLEVTDWLL